jgi:SNF family Na+-dependent transporter
VESSVSAPREAWGSKIAFILAAAGSAIGLGNIWGFPTVAAANGGAAFLLIYLLCVALIGAPVMLAELTIGRRTQRNPVGAFKALAPNTVWVAVGALGVIAGIVILSFYSVIAGWTLDYIIKTARGEFRVLGGHKGDRRASGEFESLPTLRVGRGESEREPRMAGHERTELTSGVPGRAEDPHWNLMHT